MLSLTLQKNSWDDIIVSKCDRSKTKLSKFFHVPEVCYSSINACYVAVCFFSFSLFDIGKTPINRIICRDSNKVRHGVLLMIVHFY